MDQRDLQNLLRSRAQELGDAQWAVLADAGSPAHQTFKVIEERARPLRVRVKVFTQLRAALPWLLGVYDEAEVEPLTKWVDRSSGH